jgi:hypothetical protein
MRRPISVSRKHRRALAESEIQSVSLHLFEEFVAVGDS